MMDSVAHCTMLHLARVNQFLVEDHGQDLIEYALVAGAIGLSAVFSLTSVTTKIKNAFSNIGSQLTSAV